MARKVFWTLWVTLWPIAALAPYFLSAPTAGRAEPGLAVKSPSPTPDQMTVLSSRVARIERLASAKELRIPLLAQNDTTTPPKLEPIPAEKIPSKPATVTKKSEPLPALPELQKQPATDHPRPSVSRTYGIGPRITPQEEQAQKLIHERAIARSLQRHARLEMKYRRNAGQHVLPTTTRRRTQTTGTNWVTGPRAANP